MIYLEFAACLVKNESEEQRIARLEEKQKRGLERVKNKSEEEINIKLDEKRHCDLQHQQTAAQNTVLTYRDTVNYASNI